jgi:hypothetical protein
MTITNYTFDELINKYNIECYNDRELFVKIMNGNFNNSAIVDDNILFHIGYYYNMIKKDYNLMKKYYKMAIQYNNSNAMYNLGYYYYIKKDYKSMKKYYIMAIKRGNSNAMKSLGFYYFQIKKKYNIMKKYYMMSDLIKLNINTNCLSCNTTKGICYTRCNKHYLCCNCSIKATSIDCPLCVIKKTINLY